jgi:hypothetical protein
VLIQDKIAAVDFLEFKLVTFVEQFEQHLDEDAVGAFYAEAYALLSDFDDTLQTAVDSSTLTKNINKSVD